MRPIEFNEEVLYFENATGYLYRCKKYNDVNFFIPLDFCTLDCKNNDKPIKQIYVDNISIKTVQINFGRVQPRRQQNTRINSVRLQQNSCVRNRAQGRIKIFNNEFPNGNSPLKKSSIRSNCSYNLFGASSTSVIYGIRSKTRA